MQTRLGTPIGIGTPLGAPKRLQTRLGDPLVGMRIDKILTIPMPYRFPLIDSFIDSYWARGEKKSTNGFIYIHFLLYNFL